MPAQVSEGDVRNAEVSIFIADDRRGQRRAGEHRSSVHRAPCRVAGVPERSERMTGRRRPEYPDGRGRRATQGEHGA